MGFAYLMGRGMGRKLVLAILVATSSTLAGCGGGGGSGGTTPTEDEGATSPVDPETPTQLDLDLQAVLADANVTLLPAPPAEDPAMVALGQALFFDKELSGNRNISCATCHHPTEGTGDGLSVSIGEGGSGTGRTRQLVDGVFIPRNAPPLFNLGSPAFTRMFWDNRVQQLPNGTFVTPEPALNGPNPAASGIVDPLDGALAAQALFPVTSPEEMRGQPGDNELANAPDNLTVWALLMVRLVGTDNGTVGGIPGYRTLFQAAFPAVTEFDDLTFGHAARAIAAYERSAFRADNTGLDRFLNGEFSAMSDAAKEGGLIFFGRGRCDRCHDGSRLSDQQVHALAVPQVGPGKDFAFEDTGRFTVTGNNNDRYRFRTPPLRNVALTGPWMHDGAYTTLRNVVLHYTNPPNRLATYDPFQLRGDLVASWDTDTARNDARVAALDNGLANNPPNLNGNDVDRVVAFLEALTDEASRDLTDEIPASVPSGLPVAD